MHYHSGERWGAANIGEHILKIAWNSAPSRNYAMRTDDRVLNCVVFIGFPPDENDLAKKPVFGGTAFFVDMPSDDKKYYTTYIVTARHNVEKIEGRLSIIRMNGVSGELLHFKLGPHIKWWRHPEIPDLVDVAVAPWKPPPVASYKVLRVDDWFITDEIIKDRDIGPADEVFITGLFSKLSGEQKNIPIVRSGNIAMMPDEKLSNVKTRDGSGEAEVYLIEVRSTGGISGSPVFVRETLNYGIVEDKSKKPNRIHGVGMPYLLGLVHGHWSIRPEDRNDSDLDTVTDHPDRINLGIAVVVPAKKILEVLNHPELVEMRKKAEDDKRKNDTTEEDFLDIEQSGEFTQGDFEKALKKVSRKLTKPPSESAQEKPGT